jgi:hypothetical protein
MAVSEFNRRFEIHLDGAAATSPKKICDLPVTLARHSEQAKSSI